MPSETIGPKARRILRRDLWVIREHVDVVRRRIVRRLSDGREAAHAGATALGS